jgi:hypothetical protein
LGQGGVDGEYKGSEKNRAFFIAELYQDQEKKAGVQDMEQDVREMEYKRSRASYKGIKNIHDSGYRAIITHILMRSKEHVLPENLKDIHGIAVEPRFHKDRVIIVQICQAERKYLRI